MKTTVEITDALFKEARSVAERNGLSFRQLVEEGLRTVVDRRRQRSKPFKLRDGSFQGKGLRQPLSWEEIRAAVYQGRGE